MTDRDAMRRRREAIGLSRKQLAAKIKNPATGEPVDAHTIYSWERGRYNPLPATRAAWEKALASAEERA